MKLMYNISLLLNITDFYISLCVYIPFITCDVETIETQAQNIFTPIEPHINKTRISSINSEFDEFSAIIKLCSKSTDFWDFQIFLGSFLQAFETVYDMYCENVEIEYVYLKDWIIKLVEMYKEIHDREAFITETHFTVFLPHVTEFHNFKTLKNSASRLTNLLYIIKTNPQIILYLHMFHKPELVDFVKSLKKLDSHMAGEINIDEYKESFCLSGLDEIELNYPINFGFILSMILDTFCSVENNKFSIVENFGISVSGLVEKFPVEELTVCYNNIYPILKIFPELHETGSQIYIQDYFGVERLHNETLDVDITQFFILRPILLSAPPFLIIDFVLTMGLEKLNFISIDEIIWGKHEIYIPKEMIIQTIFDENIKYVLTGFTLEHIYQTSTGVCFEYEPFFIKSGNWDYLEEYNELIKHQKDDINIHIYRNKRTRISSLSYMIKN